MYKTLILVIGFFVLSLSARPQEIKSHDHQIAINFLQIKEELNYGLVFKGPGLGYQYTAEWRNQNRLLRYEGGISFNFPMTRGILAGSLNLVPVRFSYLFPAKPEGKFSIGPYAVAEINYEIYPDLQSIYYFWFTNYSIGCVAERKFNVRSSSLDLSISVTAFGLTSRADYIDDPYFNEVGFSEFVSDINSDLRFGSWNMYNVSELEFRWTPNSGSRLAYAYAFQYYGYYDDPRLTMINQSVKLIFLPEKNK
jgi:hypothetical protein